MDVHPTKNVSIGIDPYPNGCFFIVLSALVTVHGIDFQLNQWDNL
jgi:hypothetical protein